MTARIILASALALGFVFPAKAGGFYLDQPHDFVAFSPSEQGTAVPFARTADDFLVTQSKFFLMSITVEMVVSFPNRPISFFLELHAGDAPNIPIFDAMKATDVLDQGPWNGDTNLHLFVVTYDIGGQNLPDGRYWVSPYAVGNGSGTDRAWWGTAGNGVVNNSEGYFKSEHFGVPDWTPISQSGILDFPTDFAMRIEATIPAPGALALLGLGAIVWRRGRRRSV
jgi:hypothetical protein